LTVAGVVIRRPGDGADAAATPCSDTWLCPERCCSTLEATERDGLTVAAVVISGRPGDGADAAATVPRFSSAGEAELLM